ncbi:glycosyltransferase family 2 protein [Pedobacter insulae]|uniref:Glycosyltransferase, catalytic subunit of cellulose synthase and poly-beta-1,6-N-acetylglucosamine synthase n=1 Tax=Pedobacter insulae TaxID=414048 RepID=A0A1I2THK0_9SPHI|nr:glycosyltransferase [Pedobacter insulae]SFG64323.1 Glycosyltransferase, catalytic subunit of cellulose synthase and poly-beta-1,6-N-acetylglucosamine synthase [Pedobacter insulae]
MEAISIVNYLSIALTLVYVIVVITFIRGWHRIALYKNIKTTAKTRVSILVAARNEEAHIGKTITDLLAQNYPTELVEIIIINDHSTDDTATVVTSFSNDGVLLINLNEDRALNSYKKKAIQIAIEQAGGDLIITTDADCRMGSNWLSTIVSFYEEHDFKMISSPVAYYEEKNLFEKCQTLEFSYLIGLGASTIGSKSPSTCNGANLAYEREAFYAVNGFKGIDDLASGDDELLLHKIAAKYENKVGFLKNHDAIVYTYAKETLSAFIEQRKRWASKSTRYKNKGIVMLGLAIWLFNLSIVVNGVVGIFLTPFLNVFAFQLSIKLVVEMFFLMGITSFFKRKQLLVLQPLVSTLHIVYMVYIGIAGNSGKYNWKDRMVK